MARTSTRATDHALDAALQAVPGRFRQRLIDRYLQLRAAFTQASYDSCGLRAAHFAETLLRFLQHNLSGSFTPFGDKIGNFAQECQKLEKVPSSAGPDSLRLFMPRALNFLYTLRNKRGIGHVGGDVDANEIDAATAVRIADWCVCELIRVVHKMSLEDAQALLDAIAVRQLPQVWSVAGRRRILDTSLDYKSQTLLLLYNESEPIVPSEDLHAWTEHSNFSVYKRDVLRSLHSARLVEYDRDSETVTLSPLGAQKVEIELLPALGKARATPRRRRRR